MLSTPRHNTSGAAVLNEAPLKAVAASHRLFGEEAARDDRSTRAITCHAVISPHCLISPQ